MRIKWKKFKKSLLVILGFCLLLGCSMPSYAYTEEQIAQARAWLSAHGYSPDRGGAAAAYQDYLNGRFDEELGRTTTESSTEDGTDSTEDGSEDAEEIPELLLNPFNADLIEEVETSEENDVTESTSEEVTVAHYDAIETQDGNEIVVAEDGTVVTNEMKEEIKKQTRDMDENSEAIVKEETSRAHKETLLVIAISVGLMAVVEILLYMKSV